MVMLEALNKCIIYFSIVLDGFSFKAEQKLVLLIFMELDNCTSKCELK